MSTVLKALSKAVILPVGAGMALMLGGGAAQATTPPDGGNTYAASATVSYTAQTQSNGYYCGPASTKAVLSVLGRSYSQAALASQEGTTTNGTNSIANVTQVLNADGGNGFYENKMISGSLATTAQKQTLENDILFDIHDHHAIVANILGTAYDTSGNSHSYSGGHYLTVMGYKDSGATALIYDVANGSTYWMTTAKLADWIAERGYSA